MHAQNWQIEQAPTGQLGLPSIERNQGTLTEGEGLMQLASSLRWFVL